MGETSANGVNPAGFERVCLEGEVKGGGHT